MVERIEQFRWRVEQHFGGRPGRGARYPEPLRAEAVVLARAAIAEGQSVPSVARRLGVGAVTLARWLEEPPATEWRPVEVVDEPAAEEEPEIDRGAGPTSSGLVLVTALGHRVEGLSLDEAALLLEALG